MYQTTDNAYSGGRLRATRITYYAVIVSQPEDADRLEVSRLAFGQSHRLSVMLALMQAQRPMCLKDLSAALGVTASSLQVPLENLVALGLVIPAAGDGTRKRFYTRVEGPAWVWARDLAHRA